jgi:hypothetical protein
MTPTYYGNYGVGAPVSGKYKRVFTTYPDGSELEVEAEKVLCNGRPYRCTFSLRPFEAAVFEVPYHDSTEEEKLAEKKHKNRIKREFIAAKNDDAHIPQIGNEKPVKKSKAKKSAKKQTKVVAKAKRNAKEATKVYEVALREKDGKWGVKYVGGKRTIKLFATQDEALSYTNIMATNQTAKSIILHNPNGTETNIPVKAK